MGTEWHGDPFRTAFECGAITPDVPEPARNTSRLSVRWHTDGRRAPGQAAGFAGPSMRDKMILGQFTAWANPEPRLLDVRTVETGEA